ncbi:MAG: hypothetical protein ACI4I1_08715 [Oscillospiraceae bacterium]
MKQKGGKNMNSEYILGFEQLEQILKSKKISANAVNYSYLTWLGLTPNEMTSAYFNHNTRTVEFNDRVIFVKEDRMAECLADISGQPIGKKSITSAEKELNAAEISPAFLYKMSFFNIRLEQAKLGQPEDLVRIKEMSRYIGQDTKTLEQEYADFLDASGHISAKK